MINRERFFDSVRTSLFGGSLKQSQVDGCNVILDYYEQNPEVCDQLPQLAYILATTFHETAKTMSPIEEYGKGKGKPYGNPDPQTGKCYFGRGYVQLTWKDNYVKMDKKLCMDNKLVVYPELVMDYHTALEILFKGSMDGDFTGVGIPKYINGDKCDFTNARRVINGTDKADLIAGYAQKFLKALS